MEEKDLWITTCHRREIRSGDLGYIQFSSSLHKEAVESLGSQMKGLGVMGRDGRVGQRKEKVKAVLKSHLV